MNRKNIQAAIEIMQQAESLNMFMWQADETGEDCGEDWGNPAVETTQELHACGNTACFAGYIAISDQFKKDGGSVDSEGLPVIFNSKDKQLRGTDAIAEWLGIERGLTMSLVHGDSRFGDERFYDKYFGDVQPADVIAKLEMILSGELT